MTLDGRWNCSVPAPAARMSRFVTDKSEQSGTSWKGEAAS
jgi:hypothetical protein